MGMTDQSAQLGATSQEPSDQPQAVGQADLDKFKEELLGMLKSDFDTRFAGFQQIIAKRDERIGNLESVLQELKTVDMSDDERVQLERDALAQERAAIAAERELMELQSEFPEEIKLYKSVVDKASAKDQIVLLREWRNSLTANQTPEPTPGEGEETTPNQSAIDPNNPAAPTSDGMEPLAQFERDPSLADRILQGARRLSGGE
jgi:hypothetical protein